MKKIISILMLVCLLISSAASCGNNPAGLSADEAPAENTGADAGAENLTVGGTTSAYPQMELSVSCSYGQTETAGQILDYFLDYITEHSGGNITFNVYWGATFCTSVEDLSYVQNGSVDMTFLSASLYPDVLPLTNFPSWGNISEEHVVEYYEYIMFENEETSELIAKEHESQNVKVLGVNDGGADALMAKFPISTYTDLAGHSIAAVINQSVYEDIGMTCVFSVPPDTYSNLQKGVVDCAAMALGGMVSMSWYEVAPYVILDNIYACSNFYTINLDKWNSFDEATQTLFLEAAEAGKKNSFALYGSEIENGIETINAYNESKGIDFTVQVMDEETSQQYLNLYFAHAMEDCRTNAANANKTDEMEIILTAAADYLGIE